MNKIKKMIEEMCANGVDYKKINELVDYIQPSKYIVYSTNYDNSYKIPVLTPGKTFILGYTNETKNIYNASKENPIILFDDFTCSFHWVDFSFKVKSSAAKILIPLNKTKINFRYIYFVMTEIKIDISEHKRQWIQNFSNISIPIPPIEIQNEIVRILGKYTELEKELELRTKQYEYYRDKLINQYKNSNFLYLKDIMYIDTGKLNANAMEENGIYPFFTCNKEPYKINTFSFDTLAILVSGNGSQVGHINTYNGKFDAYQRTYVLHNFLNSINYWFLVHTLKCNLKRYINLHKKDGSVPYITLPILENFKVPKPSIKEQEKIVTILNKFSSILFDNKVSISKEILLRNKQYSFMKNYLLRFDNESNQ